MSAHLGGSHECRSRARPYPPTHPTPHLKHELWRPAAAQREDGVGKAPAGLAHRVLILEPGLLKGAKRVRRQYLRPLVAARWRRA